jgi:hypothetical protein
VTAAAVDLSPRHGRTPPAANRPGDAALQEGITELREALLGLSGPHTSDEAVVALYTQAASLVVERLKAADREASELRRAAQEQTARFRSETLEAMSQRVRQFETEDRNRRQLAEREAEEVRAQARDGALAALDQVHQLRDQLGVLVEWSQGALGELEQVVDRLALAGGRPADHPSSGVDGWPLAGSTRGSALAPPPRTEPQPSDEALPSFASPATGPHHIRIVPPVDGNT